jgi:hypothetical protein
MTGCGQVRRLPTFAIPTILGYGNKASGSIPDRMSDYYLLWNYSGHHTLTNWPAGSASYQAWWLVQYLPTHLPAYTYPPTYTYTHLPTYTYPPTYTYTHIPTYTYPSTYTYTHLPIHPYLPTYLLHLSQLANLMSGAIPTYLPTEEIVNQLTDNPTLSHP